MSEPEIRLIRGSRIEQNVPRWREFVRGEGLGAPSRDPAWLCVLAQGLGHVPYAIEAVEEGCVVGFLPLLLLRSVLFGRFLISVSYLNTGGVIARQPSVAAAIIDRAVQLADELNVRYLELRHEQPIDHPSLPERLTSKVHMRLPLSKTSEELWDDFDPKVRNQVRKGEKSELALEFGGLERLDAFYDVFAENMRDLGTPVFGRALFAATLERFPGDAEICVVRKANLPVAAALLLHGCGVTEVPSASTLRRFNATNANMWMYWHLLRRAIERGSTIFDFGRSTVDGNTYKFKKQWGAQPHAAVWQYYVRKGTVGDMRRETGKYGRMIRIWQRLPLGLTRLIGPAIVRGIP